jgi:hypothetical protein
MFSIVATVIFSIVALGLVMLRKGRIASKTWKMEYENAKDKAAACVVFAVICWIITAIWLSAMSVGPYTCQLSDFADIKKAKQEIQLYSERRDKLVEIVKVELAKYPEYEKKIVGNIQPQILLQFPNLKSNETIVKTVEEIIKLEDSVYKIRASMIETQKKMFYRELSPWVIYVTPYQKLFSQQNPLVEVK